MWEISEVKLIKYRNIAIIGFLGFLVLAIIYSLFWGPAKKFGDSLMPAKTVTISAEGKVIVSPDIAKVSFAVVSEGINPKTLAENNIKKMNAAIEFVKSQGIEEKDIKTTEYNLSPRYEDNEKTKKTLISGYTLTQNVLIKVRDLSKVAEVVAGLPELGINQISSISFEVDEPEKYLAEARKQAFEKIKKKAEEMAAQNGAGLGKVISFWEYSQPIPYYENVKGMGGGGMATLALPQIQPGTEEITVQVNVSYELK